MNFIKYSYLYAFISFVVIGAGLYSLVRYGLQFSVDFTGGSVLELQLPTAPTDATALRDLVQKTEGVKSVDLSDQNILSIKADTLSTEQKQQLVIVISDVTGPVEVLRFDAIGPTISAELLKKTGMAIGIVIVFITFYVGKQFKELRYGVCAVLAMAHDSLVLLGAFSIFGVLYKVQVDVLFVTAMLTTLSFSVHDTIVVYHRIRELRIKHPEQDLKTLINYAVSGTITRSINNSMTIIFMLVALALLGGVTIKWFAVALLIGAITGTYSSACVALPLLLVWEFSEKKLRSRKRALR